MSGDPGAAPEAPPTGTPTADAEEPVLRVVRGTPDAVELAALVVVLATAAAPAAESPPGHNDPWRDHARRLGAPPSPGPGVWPTSARP